MKLFVVRHGETDVNVENKINALNDDDLNINGIKQAEKLREVFVNIDYDFIICSPLIRTIHTAKILNVKEKEIILDDRLIERDAGVFTKASLDNIDSNDWWNLYPKGDYKDAETVENVIKIIFDFLDDIKIKYNTKNVVVVTHGGVSKAFHCYFYGIPEDGNIEIYRLNNCEIKEYNFREDNYE